jgi:kumamolisin
MRFNNSIIPPGETGGVRAHVVREDLTSGELDAITEFKLPLAFRNFDELRTRVARGEHISHAEMLARYYPSQQSYANVEGWARGQGFEVGPPSSIPLVVRARGRVGVIGRVLNSRFERVVGEDGVEYSSAVTAPELPANIGPLVNAVVGLQPHLTTRRSQAQPLLTSNGYFFTPEMVREYYHATGYDGAGQVIAIIGSAPDLSDLVGFWTKCGIPQTLANVTIVNRGWMPQSWNGDFGGQSEWTGDIEWASGMAPAAKIRVYDTVDPYNYVPALLADMQIVPGLRQASLSEGLAEAQRTPDGTRAESQLYAALAAEGMTFFVSSGDGGSNNDPHMSVGGAYSSSYPLSADYPASDPCVVAVGGTKITVNRTTWAITGEVSYGDYDQNGKLFERSSASGGGISTLFARPTWQAGTGVPTTAMRCVPDVAGVWGGDVFYAYEFYKGNDYFFGGTSLTSPMWAGLCALLNQARSAAGKPALGLLGPRIYPLIGTDCFNDITAGTNGAYTAGQGYDLCTGVGTPNIAKLAVALVNQQEPAAVSFPVVTQQPQTQVVALGSNVTLSIGAQSSETVSYQWIMLDASKLHFAIINDSEWATLSDDMTFSGTKTSSLTIANAPAALDGAMFACRVVNSYGVAITLPAILGVSSTTTAIAPRVVNAVGAHVHPGESAVLSVDVVGTAPISYQWSDLNGKAIPGATNASLAFPSPRPEDSGGYWVKIANAGGSTQYGCALYVLSSPTIISPATIAATVGESLSYQLYAANNLAGTSPSHSDYSTSYSVVGLPSGLTVNSALGVIAGVPSDSGTFHLTITVANDLGSDTVDATLVVNRPGPPKIVSSPGNVSMGLPGVPPTEARFEVAATGGNLHYQWLRDGVAIHDGSYIGTNTPVLRVEGRPSLVGGYSAVVSNDQGSATSDAATLTVGNAPAILIQPPHQQTVVAGSSVWLNVDAEGNGLDIADGVTYQWRLDGTTLPGATKASLNLGRTGTDQAGNYTVDVKYGGKTMTSAVSRVDVRSNSRLINISTRAWVGAGDNALFAGFAISGSAPKKVLLRAAGPALAGFSIDGFVADPRIEVHDAQNNILYTNDDWAAAPAKADAIEQAAAAAGAFGLTRGSKDAALLVTLVPGTYSAVVTGTNGTSGIAIAEVYDAEPADHRSVLANVSSRSFVQGGDKTMIAGFVIDGTQPRTVLVRAAGPAISLFGVPSILPNPSFEIRPINQPDVVVATNDDWSADAAAAMAVQIANRSTNAFDWPSGSKDAAMVLTLDPGGYSIIVHDTTGSFGNALVEVYDLQ